MIQVSILGAGNVATHLTKAFLNNPNITIVQLYARSKEQLASFKSKIATTNSIGALLDADVYIVAVSDNAISKVTQQLKLANKLIVHTSGAASIESIQNTTRKGVFYPLQSFSKEKKVNLKEVPFCIEASNTADFNTLSILASYISTKVYAINSKQRKYMHVAAVFISNFSNHMCKIGHDICEKNNIPFEILNPLIQETAQKVLTLQPELAQTGPAIRNDSKTIAKHITLLTKEQEEIYKLITKSIQNNGEEL